MKIEGVKYTLVTSLKVGDWIMDPTANVVVPVLIMEINECRQNIEISFVPWKGDFSHTVIIDRDDTIVNLNAKE
jgi:hypothetical protein